MCLQSGSALLGLYCLMLGLSSCQHNSCIIVYILDAYSSTSPQFGVLAGIYYGVVDLDIALYHVNISIGLYIAITGNQLAFLANGNSSLVVQIGYGYSGTNIYILVPGCLLLGLIRLWSNSSLVSSGSALGGLYSLAVTTGGSLLGIGILVASQDATGNLTGFGIPAHKLRQALCCGIIPISSRWSCLQVNNLLWYSGFSLRGLSFSLGVLLDSILGLSSCILLCISLGIGLLVVLLGLSSLLKAIIGVDIQLAVLVVGLGGNILALNPGIYIYISIGTGTYNVHSSGGHSPVIHGSMTVNVQIGVGNSLRLEVPPSRNNIVGLSLLAKVYLGSGVVAYNIYYGVHIGRTILCTIGLLDGGSNSGLVGSLRIHGDVLGCLYIAIYIYNSSALGIIVGGCTSQIRLGNLVVLGLGIVLSSLGNILGGLFCLLGSVLAILAYRWLNSDFQLVVYGAGGLGLDAAGGIDIGILADINLGGTLCFISQYINLVKQSLGLVAKGLATLGIYDGIADLVP